MKFRQIPITLSIAVLALVAATMAPLQGTASQDAPATQITMTSDGIKADFSVQTDRQALTFNVRIVGPGDYRFQNRVESQQSIQWLPPDNLRDGRYTWEAWIVSADPGAPVREMTRVREKRTIDHHYDGAFKRTHQASGSFIVQANEITIDERAQGQMPLTRRVASALLDLLVPSASAQLASFAEDDFLIENPAGSDCTGLRLYNDPSLLDMSISNEGGDVKIAASSAACGGNSILTVARDAQIGVNTEAPEDVLHLATGAPVIRFDDTDDTQVWRQLAGGGGFRLEDQTQGSVPFLIENTAPTDSLRVNASGDIGMGLNPLSKVHVLHTDSNGLRLQNTFGEQFLVGAGVVGTAPFAGFYVHDQGSDDTAINISSAAPPNNFMVDTAGRTGMGTSAPIAPLHVQRADDTANIVVEDLGAGSPQVMFQLLNNGFPQFNMQDTSQTDVSWSFRLSGTAGSTERFTITKIGTGGAEFELFADGSATFRGPVTADGVLLTSTREAKTDFRGIDEREVLDKLASLEISQWRYKDEAEGTTHIGPIAEEFHEVFGLSDGKRLNMIDTNGIAFAAIQALHRQDATRDAAIESLREDNRELRERLAALERQLLD
ncbi:MAG: hypothetical protein GVY32_01065 [Gammaproteobacteria bacterium]|jgi:hypothetical protein|nr:hypothetical protein [Gammaproteobacteria bacterium]